jgi:DNA-binding NtrC family response regulator
MSTKVLVVDDKQLMRDSVGATLQQAGYQVVSTGDGGLALSMIARHRPAMVITDLKMPEMDGMELLERLRQMDDQLPVVVMTAYGSVDSAVRAMKQGAFDFIQKPFEGDQLVMTVRRAVEHHKLLQENAALRTSAPTFQEAPVLVGRSPAMRQLAQQIQQIAQSQGTVLISGESGTGKEVVARTIHAHSLRRDRVMLCVNCAALSSGLLESELFGHEKGAFTGADKMRKGRFELADGGTLLLDEISEISPQLQAKLLRVLQERQFERVGSSLSMPLDVRVIATTNRALTQSVMAGEFREDLYYRLNVLPIHLPPLRDRSEDVPLLVEHFMMQTAMREGRESKQFDDEALRLMKRYRWPGNVRELQNICERASVLTRGQVVSGGMIEPWLVCPEPVGGVAAETLGGSKRLEDVEREQIVHTLGKFNGNRQRTAEALGIGVRTLGLKLKKWKELELVAQTL